MREDFLHYVWRVQRFAMHDLRTTEGKPIEILSFGTYNTNAGPDFLDARIRINGTLWAGNVEMHLKAAEWYDHQHKDDPAYDNVVLHVVLEEDIPAVTQSGQRVPCLELRHRIPPGLIRTYWRMLHNEYWVPCQNLLHLVPDLTRHLWLDRLVVERLEARTTEMHQRLQHNQRDWEETFYQFLARSFGLTVNGPAFEMLARSLPLRILLKHKHSLLQLEALLFGQAGMLEEEVQDEYPRLLQREFRLLRHKYQLTPIPVAAWRFMRMRPANFPTMRLAQLAALLYQTGNLFSKSIAATSVSELENMFDVELSNYWRTHYRIDKESKPQRKTLGGSTVRLFIINTIAPFLFLYGRERDDRQYYERALQWLEALPAEHNRVIDGWAKLGLQADSASESQALLQLKQTYCDRKRCLECSLGNAILQKMPEDDAPNSGPRISLNEEAQLYTLQLL